MFSIKFRVIPFHDIQYNNDGAYRFVPNNESTKLYQSSKRSKLHNTRLEGGQQQNVILPKSQ